MSDRRKPLSTGTRTGLAAVLCLYASLALGPLPDATPASAAQQLRPQIARWLIPFSPKRKHEMAAYSARHYGERTWRLRRPRVIVEHFAEAGSAAAVYNTFAPDHPDPELHELPRASARPTTESASRACAAKPTATGATARCASTAASLGS